jgi:tRNA(Ile)-lysidine synthase
VKGQGLLNFEQRIFQFIGKNKLIAPRGLVVIGISGGADSMALLMALAGLRHVLGVQLHAAHFNHQFRPEASRDERFVANWCGRFNVPLTVGHRFGRKIKHLSEDDARQMRIEFFVKTARRLKAQSVALAHTRNDLAETVLMRLMRGSGLYGLRAILPRRCIEGVTFVRPLMGVNRLDVEKYLKAQKIPFCTDATNLLTVYERNKVRHELLPLLAKEFNPQIINALSDLAATAGEDYEFLSMHARKQFEKNVIIANKRVKLDLKSIRRLHPAMLRLMFRLMAEILTKDPAALTFEHIHALENLAAQSQNGAVNLPHHLKAVKTQKFLELYHA